MNKTFEKAFNKLPAVERDTIVSCVGGKVNSEDAGTLDEALIKLFVLLRERKGGDLNNLTEFEEKVMEKAVVAGNTRLDSDNFR